MTITYETLQTPALLIHLDRLRHNIARTIALCGSVERWRPHVKTCKVPEVLDELLAAGVRQFKVATTREAAVLLAQAREPIDVLVAIAHRGANLERIVALARAFPRHRLAMISEEPAHAAAVAAAGLGVFVDVDPHWGRSGIPIEQGSRIGAVAAAAGAHWRGLHCYEGHLTANSPAERQVAAEPIHTALCELAQRLAARELVTSGTPGFVAALAFAEFDAFAHAVSPGTVTYWDARSAELGIAGYRPAVEVLARVVSRPSERQATVDAGSKAIDAAAGEPVVVVVGAAHLRAKRPSEEHLPLLADEGQAPPLGALLHLIPRHVCPTVNLADEAVLVDGGVIRAIVPVRARGHETWAGGVASELGR